MRQLDGGGESTELAVAGLSISRFHADDCCPLITRIEEGELLSSDVDRLRVSV